MSSINLTKTQPSLVPVSPSPVATKAASVIPSSAAALTKAAQTQAPAAVRDAFATPSQSPAALLGAATRAAVAPSFRPLDSASASVQAAAQSTIQAAPRQLPQLSPQDTFQVRAAAQDEFGTTHVRLERLHNGVPVFGEQAVGHVAQDGGTTVTGLMGQIPAELGKGQPSMSAQKAADRIISLFGLKPGDVRAEDMTRVLAQGADGKYRDTWMIEDFFAGAKKLSAQVNAEDGKVSSWGDDHGLISEQDRKRAEETVARAEASRAKPSAAGLAVDAGVVLGNDRSQFSGMVELGGTPVGTDGKQQMLDTTRGQGIETLDNQGKTQDSAPVTMIDNNGAWGEATDPKGQKNAIDAQYGAQMTYDFYKQVLGRDSIDGRGQKLDSVVNARLVDENGRLAPNAFWDGQKMTYGIGDGRTFGDLTSMDVAGHEITHGVTQASAGLIYRNESGGINESLSDIMGTGVEWYAAKNNPNIQSNFLLGEDSFTPGVKGDALRYMDQPSRDGSSLDHYSQMKKFPHDDGIGSHPETDNGGVHSSSGIMNNAFYLMSEGGKNPVSRQGVDKPVGIEGSLKIFSRAQQYYMTPNTTFAFARESTVRAATDLFGKDSAQVAAVKQAWSAVGVQDAARVG